MKILVILRYLMVVIAIIAILAAMLLPTLDKARKKGLDIKCVSNLKQQGVAFNLYVNDSEGFYPPYANGKTTNDSWAHVLMTSKYIANPAMFYCTIDSALSKLYSVESASYALSSDVSSNDSNQWKYHWISYGYNATWIGCNSGRNSSYRATPSDGSDIADNYPTLKQSSAFNPGMKILVADTRYSASASAGEGGYRGFFITGSTDMASYGWLHGRHGNATQGYAIEGYYTSTLADNGDCNILFLDGHVGVYGQILYQEFYALAGTDSNPDSAKYWNPYYK